jgi:type IV secretory pathway VirB10-like protein
MDLFSSEPTPVEEETVEEQQPFATPAPPTAKRLNRNALTVAAIIMGMTVIACLVVLRGESNDKPIRRTADPIGQDLGSPTFLERPARTPAYALHDDSIATLASQAQSRRGRLSVPTSGPPAIQDFPLATSAPTAIVSSRQPAPREKAFSAALSHSAIAGRGEASADASTATAAATNSSLAAEESQLVAYGDSLMRSATRSNSSAPPTPISTRVSFMQRAGDQGGRSTLASLEPSPGLFVLRAGTVIPAMLLTAITSDLPGDCLGQVSRDVYDSQRQQLILIPKGSRLMCRYDDQVAAGQGRLLIAWTRLILPDGRSFTLPGLAAKDGQGQTGAKGDVDNHTARVFGRALLLSAIGAGAQLSQPRQASILAGPSPGQVAAGAVGQEMSNVALEVLRRGMDQPPTITLPQGATFNVFLNGDLIFDGPYTAQQ